MSSPAWNHRPANGCQGCRSQKGHAPLAGSLRSAKSMTAVTFGLGREALTCLYLGEIPKSSPQKKNPLMVPIDRGGFPKLKLAPFSRFCVGYLNAQLHQAVIAVPHPAA